MGDNILEIKNLSKSYENFKLDNINFTLKKGYIMGLIGENGAGKTTTIKLIMNLIKKDSGIIKIFNKDNTKFEQEVKSKIGFYYDECFFYENSSIKDTSKIISSFYSDWDWNIFNSYLKRFDLDEKQYINKLSKGMKTKFYILLALSHNAKFIILDEPTAGLDPVARVEILEILQEIIEKGEASILLSTHIISDLEKIADYITYIHKGKVVFSKSKEEILDEYKVVKGPVDKLTDKMEKYFEGIIKTNYYFEGLTNRLDILKEYENDLVIENPSLEQIMVFENKK